MLSFEAKVALQSFLSSFTIFAIIGLTNIIYNLTSLYVNTLILVPCVVVTFMSTRLVYKGEAFEIAIRSSFLGIIFALGIYIKLVSPSNLQIFGPYLCIMAFFHYSEYVAIAIIQPEQVSLDSFMLNHSPEYKTAAVAACIEFGIESYYFPALKEMYIVSNLGLCICIAGEILRKFAIFTAGKNFNHLVQSEKAKGHVLVTHGVYNWFRHPSYVGWFYWSIGTQITLVNPICTVGYAIVSWMFFKSRVYIEEITLLNFFGQQYCDYQQQVATGLPFISGYKI